MSESPNCPECDGSYCYEDGINLACPDCGHEWNPAAATEAGNPSGGVTDANGNLLQNGDNVTVIKDLKVKGAQSALKMGTKVKNIRLVEGDHDIDCRIPGFGAMMLKSKFVKKS